MMFNACPIAENSQFPQMLCFLKKGTGRPRKFRLINAHEDYNTRYRNKRELLTNAVFLWLGKNAQKGCWPQTRHDVNRSKAIRCELRVANSNSSPIVCHLFNILQYANDFFGGMLTVQLLGNTKTII